MKRVDAVEHPSQKTESGQATGSRAFSDFPKTQLCFSEILGNMPAQAHLGQKEAFWHVINNFHGRLWSCCTLNKSVTCLGA